MSRRSWRWICFVAALLVFPLKVCPVEVSAAQPAGSPAGFLLTDGDRVVLLGSTFIERDPTHGYLEAALTSRFYPAQIRFRNLGWSGDNVFGEARAGFGSVADGFAQLKSHVLALEPTVILLNYGTNESFAGQAGLESFLAGLDVLLKTLDETKARIVFISPLRHEDLGRPLPDPAEHNQNLKLYSEAIAAVAAKRQASWVNLYEELGQKLQPPSPLPLTDNGIHLTAYGYWRAAAVIEQALGMPPRRWRIEIDAKRHNITANGTRVSQAKFSPTSISFQAFDQQLPLAPPPAGAPPGISDATGPRILRIFDLPAGKYALQLDGQEMVIATARQWSAGVAISTGPDFAQAEKLRQTIVAKNLLYFHRWRPQNETYLFGFRKHEQGQNAVEIPQFDPLVAAQEAASHSLAAPVQREYQIVPLDSK